MQIPRAYGTYNHIDITSQTPINPTGFVRIFKSEAKSLGLTKPSKYIAELEENPSLYTAIRKNRGAAFQILLLQDKQARIIKFREETFQKPDIFTVPVDFGHYLR